LGIKFSLFAQNFFFDKFSRPLVGRGEEPLNVLPIFFGDKTVEVKYAHRAPLFDNRSTKKAGIFVSPPTPFESGRILWEILFLAGLYEIAGDKSRIGMLDLQFRQ
jgi:hypothetical protein